MVIKSSILINLGIFKSPIKKTTERFFKVADRLLSGRLCISSMCIAGAKVTLETAIRYSQQRLTVGNTGESDTPIMAYQLQQNAILPLLARTVVLNFGHNDAKDLFADPTGREHDQIKTFCAIKALVSWNTNDVATVCRERCGGGGFTAHSRIGESLEGGHSGMTAEGDNRVLMQKVVKDILTDVRNKVFKHPQLTKCPVRQIPKQDSVSDLETLTNLIYYREQAEIQEMVKILKDKIMTQEKSFFEVWTNEVSDNIQSLAESYGERICLEAALKRVNAAQSPKFKATLEKIVRLHCLAYVKKNLGYYLINGVVSSKAAKDLDTDYQQAVKDLVPHVNEIVEAFNHPKTPQLWGPIARDYVKFNAQPNPENVDAAGALFDFRKGPKL